MNISLFTFHFAECFGIRGVLTPNVYCKLDDNCLGVSCCFDLKLFIFRRSLNAFVRYDPCNFIISIGVGSWVKNIEIFESRFGEYDTKAYNLLNRK